MENTLSFTGITVSDPTPTSITLTLDFEMKDGQPNSLYASPMEAAEKLLPIIGQILRLGKQ